MGSGTTIVVTVKRILSRVVDFGLYAAIAVMLYTLVSRKLSGPKVGTQAAAIDLPTVGPNPGRFRLQDHRGKPVLIEVFASWCSACRHSAPTLVEAWRKRRGQGVTFVGVSVDSNPDDAARAKTEWQLPYDVALDDGHTMKAYGIEVLPTLVLVDRDGRVHHVSTGAPSSSQLDGWLSEL